MRGATPRAPTRVFDTACAGGDTRLLSTPTFRISAENALSRDLRSPDRLHSPIPPPATPATQAARQAELAVARAAVVRRRGARGARGGKGCGRIRCWEKPASRTPRTLFPQPITADGGDPESSDEGLSPDRETRSWGRCSPPPPPRNPDPGYVFMRAAVGARPFGGVEMKADPRANGRSGDPGPRAPHCRLGGGVFRATPLLLDPSPPRPEGGRGGPWHAEVRRELEVRAPRF
ncbi:hypothetical protein JHW43_002446 [Diplocarpon mali]|nr:hypothetical protein JHW43_002446 [Diplocarpon mali]